MRFAFVLLLFSFSINAQTLNAYAKVSAISGAKTILTVTSVNETSHTFTIGGQVVIMQMQDNVIGTNTTNIAAFGDLSSIANAGSYEIRTISARSPATGTPTNITLSDPLTTTFNIGSNSSVQLITFRNLGTNYTTTTNITGLAWNGNVGGVIAIDVTNTLTLNHSISANNIGFRGGARSNNNGGSVCVAANSTMYTANNANLGYKGEGIFLRTDVSQINARGKILNGGGGGGDHNAGGGGGGNYTAGGQGGNGYNNCSAFPGGGLAGIDLSSVISGNRIFMGGGGGGGQQNNGVATAGGNGGGVILLKSGTLVTNTVCGSPVSITANGQAANNTGGNDGGGGGGAGGSIVLQVSNFSVSATCTLAVSANGGNGSNCTDGTPHAGGGGGGQGVVIYSSVQPTLNVVTTTSVGAAGRDNSGGTISAGSGAGAVNAGIVASAANPLPIELISFEGKMVAGVVELYWKTATEINNDYFVVERSKDAITFNEVGTMKANNTINTSNYQLNDTKPYRGTNYYRLKQIDFDGTYTYSHIITVEFNDAIEFSVFPNPKTQQQSLVISLDKDYGVSMNLSIYDVTGKQVHSQIVDLSDKNEIVLDNLNLASGIYVVRLSNDDLNATQKLIIE
jgi:hypothetical protein